METIIFKIKSEKSHWALMRAGPRWRLETARFVTLICLATFNGTPFAVIFIFSSMHISALLRKHRPPHLLSFTRISSLSVCVCACMQGGRSWLKFSNFLLTNEDPCAFFLLTNGPDREVGGGCCLATAGRISDHVGPIVLSLHPWETLHAICCEKYPRASASQSC